MKHVIRLFLYIILSALLGSCSSYRYKTTNKVHEKQAKDYIRTLEQFPPATPGQVDSINISPNWAGTVNFGLRKPNFVIIHHTAQDSVQQTLKTFTVKVSAVSAHYVIGKDGTVYHMLNDYFRAQHAGVSKWGNTIDLNSASIGIELDNNGSEPFSDAQIASLLKILGNLKKNYTIPTANFIGHADIAPKRKPDPNEYFPWKKLAEQGFGLWYDDILEVAPPTFDPQIGLRIIGYDISNMNSAIIAFKRHFIQTDLTPKLTQHDMDVLYNLYRKYL